MKKDGEPLPFQGGFTRGLPQAAEESAEKHHSNSIMPLAQAQAQAQVQSLAEVLKNNVSNHDNGTKAKPRTERDSSDHHGDGGR